MITTDELKVQLADYGTAVKDLEVQMRRLPKGHNVFELNAPRFWQCRNLGANSARAVKKMPFKAIYRGE